MHWVIVASIVFFSSTALYLILRKATLLKIPNEIQSLSLFLFSAIGLLLINISRHVSMHISTAQFLILLAAASVLWLGNTTLLKSMETTPNPGYTVVIAKSYLLITTFFSAIFFGSFLSTQTLIGSGCIVLFLFLILVEKSHRSSHGTRWLLCALVTFFMWGFEALLIISLKNSPIDAPIILMYISFFYSLMATGEIIVKKTPIQHIKQYVLWIGLISACSLCLNLFQIIGYRIAPNPGFIDASGAASVGAITFCAVFLFHDHLTIRKSIGIVGILFGLALLII